jgi:pimeloyl-ACP methyl ester carboxylesterase
MPNSPSTPPTGAQDLRLTIGGDVIAIWDRPGPDLPVVLVHGNGASKEAFRGLFDAKALARHRLIALDMPGCGESADAHAPHETYTLPGLSAAVMGVVKALGLARYILAGWSLGGHVAIQTVVDGAMPDGIVLTGTPPCGPDAAEIAQTFLPVPGAEFISAENPSAETRATFLKTVYAPATANAALVRAAERADGRLRHRFFEHIFQHPELEPQRTTIARWPHPFALIQGQLEPFFDAAAQDKLAWKNLWRGGTQWIEGAGHAPFVSHPEEYARALAAFAADLERIAVSRNR